MQQTAIDQDVWRAKRIVKAYFDYIRPHVGRIGPSRMDRQDRERSSPKYEAFVRVIRSLPYPYYEESLRAAAESFGDEIPGFDAWPIQVKDFCDLLDIELEDDPFDPTPDVPSKMLSQACISLAMAAYMIGFHRTTVMRWAEKEMVVARRDWQGCIWIQIDSLLKMADRKARHAQAKAARRRVAAKVRTK